MIYQDIEYYCAEQLNTDAFIHESHQVVLGLKFKISDYRYMILSRVDDLCGVLMWGSGAADYQCALIVERVTTVMGCEIIHDEDIPPNAKIWQAICKCLNDNAPPSILKQPYEAVIEEAKGMFTPEERLALILETI